jgi:cold shock CspA family protein
MASGLLKWFDDASGYGSIARGEGGADLLVRGASVAGDVHLTLTDVESVEFEPRKDGIGPEDVVPSAALEECDHCSLEPVDLAGARIHRRPHRTRAEA